MTAPADIYHKRRWDGWREHWENKGGNIDVPFECPYSDRITYVDEFLGAWHSDSTLDSICTSITLEPLGDAHTTGGYKNVLFTAHYTPEAEATETNKVFSDWRERWEGGGEGISIGKGFRWGSKTGSVFDEGQDVSVVKIFPTATITLTGTTSLFTPAGKGYVLNTIGKLNHAAFTIKGVSYTAKHLLFLGGDFDEQANDTSLITYRFAYRHDNTWNEFWYPRKSGGPGFSDLIASDGSPVYDSDVFSNLHPKNW